MTERFSKVSDLTIIVIGDIILDEYHEGTITRMSAEAPIPIVDKTDTRYVLGGSANVAANLLSLGSKPILIGTIGNDNNGKTIKTILTENNISPLHILHTSKPTTVKTRVMVDEKQIFRIDSEDKSLITDDESSTLFNTVKSILKSQEIDGIIFQDYNKGIFSPSLITSLITLAQQYKVTTFVDPKFENYWEYRAVDYFKPNKKELYSALDNSKIELKSALNTTRLKLNCKNVICTLAQDGISSSNEDGYLHRETKEIDVVDVSGAGDTTMAMICIAVLLDYPIHKILDLSNAAGRAACLKQGVSTVSLEDINA